MDVCIKIHSIVSNICGYILVWTKLVGQMTNTASVVIRPNIGKTAIIIQHYHLLAFAHHWPSPIK